MKKSRYIFAAAMVIIILSSCLAAQPMPDNFQGKVIAEGKKPEWLPDGSGISYTKDDQFYIYDLKKNKSKKIFQMDIAEYIWINRDSLLAIEWPPNVQEKQRVAKIVRYWIVDKSGRKSLFAADTLLTERIPGYKDPFRLKDGVVGIRNSRKWKQNLFPQSEKMVAFAGKSYDAEKGYKSFAYLASSDIEGGAILFKDLDQNTTKIIVVKNRQFNLDLSPDYSLILSNAEGRLVVEDTVGNVLVELTDYLDPDDRAQFRKFSGHIWNNASDGFGYYEIYNQPDDQYRLCYFDLKTHKQSLITWTNYYGQKNLKFSPDDKLIAARTVNNGTDYIILMEVPQTAGE